MRDEDGSVLWLTWPALALTVVVLVLVVDLAAYLVASERAGSAADAAALAAIAVADARAGMGGDPGAVAARVARTGGGELRACGCPRGAEVVTVEVAVPVRALVVTRFAGRTVTATARAHLVPEDRT